MAEHLILEGNYKEHLAKVLQNTMEDSCVDIHFSFLNVVSSAGVSKNRSVRKGDLHFCAIFSSHMHSMDKNPSCALDLCPSPFRNAPDLHWDLGAVTGGHKVRLETNKKFTSCCFSGELKAVWKRHCYLWYVPSSHSCLRGTDFQHLVLF